MKKVKAIPKFVFDENFSNETFINHNNACFISILDFDNDEQKFDSSISNFLQVKMFDIEEDLTDNRGNFYQKPSDEELLKIVNFIIRNKDKNIFIVHCSAGISRSGAVATYIMEKFYDEIDK